MKRALYFAIVLVTILCLAIPAMSIAKPNRASGKASSMDRSMDRQNYRQEQNMNRYQYQHQYRNEYQKQEMPKERYREQKRVEAPEKDQLRKQVRDPSTHLPDEGSVEQ